MFQMNIKYRYRFRVLALKGTPKHCWLKFSYKKKCHAIVLFPIRAGSQVRLATSKYILGGGGAYTVRSHLNMFEHVQRGKPGVEAWTGGGPCTEEAESQAMPCTGQAGPEFCAELSHVKQTE